jgi:hypothetical protein
MTINESYAKFFASYGHLSRAGILLMIYMISRQKNIVDLKEFMKMSGCSRRSCYQAKIELKKNGITMRFIENRKTTSQKET